MLSLCLPCRRAGARRLPAARARTRRWHRCGAGVGLLLLLPVIGLACAAPAVLMIFSLPLFLALLLRCWSLDIPLLQWQARSTAKGSKTCEFGPNGCVASYMLFLTN